MASSSLWQRFQRYFVDHRELRFSLDPRIKVAAVEEAVDERFSLAESL